MTYFVMYEVPTSDGYLSLKSFVCHSLDQVRKVKIKIVEHGYKLVNVVKLEGNNEH